MLLPPLRTNSAASVSLGLNVLKEICKQEFTAQDRGGYFYIHFSMCFTLPLTMALNTKLGCFEPFLFACLIAADKSCPCVTKMGMSFVCEFCAYTTELFYSETLITKFCVRL